MATNVRPTNQQAYAHVSVKVTHAARIVTSAVRCTTSSRGNQEVARHG